MSKKRPEQPEEPIIVEISDEPASLADFMTNKLDRTITAELPIPRAIVAAQAIQEMRDRAKQYSEDPEIMEEGQDRLMQILVLKAKEKRLKRSNSVIQDTRELAAEQGFPYYQKLAFRRWLKYLPENLRQRYLIAAEYLKPFDDILKSDEGGRVQDLRERVVFVHDTLQNDIPEDPTPFELNAALPKGIRHFISYLKFIDIKVHQKLVEFDNDEIITELRKYAVVFSREIKLIENPVMREIAEEILKELKNVNGTKDAMDMIAIYKTQLSRLPAWSIVVPDEVPGELIQIMGDPEKLFQKWNGMLMNLNDVDPKGEYALSNLERIMNELLLFTEHNQVLLNSFGKPLTDKVLDDLPEKIRGKIVRIIKEAKEILVLLSCIYPDQNGQYNKAILSVLEKAIAKHQALSSLLNEEYSIYHKEEDVDLDLDFDFGESSSKPETTPLKYEPKKVSETEEIDIQFSNLIKNDKVEDLYSGLLKQYSFPLEKSLKDILGCLQIAQQESANGKIGEQITDSIEEMKEVLQRLAISALKLSDENIMMYDVFPEMKVKIDKCRKQREKVVNFNEEMNEELSCFGEMFEALNSGKSANLALVLGMFDTLIKLMNRHSCLENLLSDVKEIEWAKLKDDIEMFLSTSEIQTRSTIKDISARVSNFMTGMNSLTEMKFNPPLIDHDKEKINNACESINTAKATLDSVLNTVRVTKEFQEAQGIDVIINIENYRSTIEQTSRLLKYSSAALFNCMDRNRGEVDQIMWILDYLISKVDDITSADLLNEEKMTELQLQFTSVETNLQTLPIRLQI